MRSLELAIKFLAGERMVGTSAERIALTTGTDTLGSNDGDGSNQGDTTFVAAGDTNGVAMPSGLGLKSMHFDGNDSISINDVKDFPASSGSVGTISLWYYNTGDQESKQLLSFGDANANQYLSFQTRSSGDDKIVMHNQDTSGNNWEIRNAGSLSTSAWHHAVASQNGTAVVCYVDGVELTSWDSQGDKSAWVESYLDRVRIGCDNKNNAGDAGHITGNITEVAFWNVALTEAQVQSLYGNGGSTAKKANTIPEGLRAYYDGSGVSNAAVLIYPDLPNGTVFEESDTGSHYMWDGTRGWNEMS